jgi:ParB-like chromosome segregation protein Spo0J
MKIENKLITDLKPATYNPRQISKKQYNDLKESIKKFGLVDPIIINQNDNIVVGGHQRLKIAKELKYVDIECVVLDLSKEEERELNIRLNKNTGDFDIDVLANEFDIDELVDWGFKHIDLGINVDKIQKDLSDDIELQYKIEVEVISEKEQEKLYNDLTKKGYVCRILTL